MNEKEFPFCIRSFTHTEDNMPPVHSHDFVELVYIADGEAKHSFEGELYDISAGDVYIINPGEVHTYVIQPGNKLEIINCLFMPSFIDESLLKELGISDSMDYFYVHPFLDNNERFHHGLNLRGQDAADVLALLNRMAEEYKGLRKGYSTLIRLQLIQLLVQLSRIYEEQIHYKEPTFVRHQERRILVQRICGYLERHYHQKLTLAILSDLFNISSRHLNRIFKEETGKTVIEALHVIRIERAKHLLIDSDDKVISIAMEVGYDDPAFFTRLFSRKVGVSPGKYRGESINNIVESLVN